MNGAMYAFSQSKGTPVPTDWNGMGVFTIGGGGGTGGQAIGLLLSLTKAS
jgi:hypothetical protein